MTDSSEALSAPSADAPERRFIVSRSGRMTRKLVGGPTRLNSRMLRMIQLMVYGDEDDPEHTPYDVADAAKAVGYQARAGRALMNDSAPRSQQRSRRCGGESMPDHCGPS
jgi:hypothetical protein